MKKILLTLITLVTIAGYAQKKEKIKGNKEVLIKKFLIPDFSRIEIGEKFNLAIQKSVDTTRIAIETDDNLFDVIHFSVEDGVLRFNTSKEIVKSKRLRITVFASPHLNTIIVSEKAKVMIEDEMNFEVLKIEMMGKAEMECQIQVKQKLTVKAADKVELIINGQSKIADINISETAEVKGDFSATEMLIILNDHAYCDFEGTAKRMQLTANNKSEAKCKKLKVLEAFIKVFDKANIQINVSNQLKLLADGNSVTEIYGTPKINLKRFKDNATLYKK